MLSWFIPFQTRLCVNSGSLRPFGMTDLPQMVETQTQTIVFRKLEVGEDADDNGTCKVKPAVICYKTDVKLWTKMTEGGWTKINLWSTMCTFTAGSPHVPVKCLLEKRLISKETKIGHTYMKYMRLSNLRTQHQLSDSGGSGAMMWRCFLSGARALHKVHGWMKEDTRKTNCTFFSFTSWLWLGG